MVSAIHCHLYMYTHIHDATASLAQLSAHCPPLLCIHRETEGLQWLSFFWDFELKSSHFQTYLYCMSIYIMALLLLYVYVCTHTCTTHKCSSMPMAVIIRYLYIPKHFAMHYRNLHIKPSHISDASCHKVFLKVVSQTAFQLPSFLSVVSVCKPRFGESHRIREWFGLEGTVKIM